MTPQKFPHLQLPLQFDVAQLTSDLDRCIREMWPQHYNTNDFTGSWKAISLRSLTGAQDHVFAHEGEYKDTPLLAQCDYFKQVLQTFQCVKSGLRLLSLEPGTIVKPHTDTGLSYSEGLFRIHVPILTHDKVEFIVGGDALTMLPGSCWYADFTLPHSVANHGKTPRIHLVMDCIPNEWTDALFSNLGMDVTPAPSPNSIDQMSRENLLQMIDLLMESNEPASVDIIEECKNRLAELKSNNPS